MLPQRRPREPTLNYFCPHWGDLLNAGMFESERQMRSWLQEETNYQPWRLDKECPDWRLVPYTHEVADLITRLVERMA